jgi:hypothetical protein
VNPAPDPVIADLVEKMAGYRRRLSAARCGAIGIDVASAAGTIATALLVMVGTDKPNEENSDGKGP